MPIDHQAHVAESELPSPAGVVQRVLQLLGQDSATIPLIGQALGADPVMTGRVIRLANAAIYGGRAPAASLTDAMQRIGLNALRQTLISFALVDRYRSGPCRGFDYHTFWAQSLACGIVARRLAALKRLPAPGEAFTVGLLARIGELALASLHPDRYGEVHQALAGATTERIVLVEQGHFGRDRFVLAEQLIREWQLPETMAVAVRACGNPDAAGLLPHAMSMRLARLLQIAVQLGAFYETPEAPAVQQIQALRALCVAGQVPPDELSSELPSINAEWREWALALDLIVRGNAPDTLEPPQAAEIIPFPGVNVLSAPMYIEPPAAPIAPPADPAEDARGDGQRSASVHSLASGPGGAPRNRAFVEAVRRIQRMQTMDFVPAAQPQPLRMVFAHPEDAHRDRLFDLLCAQGHQVLLADTGTQALSMVVRDQPQLVLCDLSLRDMDALTFLHCLRNQRTGREIYVLASGAREQIGALESAFAAGADDFLGMPARSAEVLSRLRGARRFIEMQDRWRADHAEMRRLAADLASANARLEGLVDIDELTGMPNRRRAYDCLGEAIARAESRKQPLSVFLLDIDGFNEVNSRCGSDAGDEVVRQASRALQACARSEDVVARVGSEAFLVIAPGAPAAAAAGMAERLRLSVARVRVATTSEEVAVTLSVGAAIYDPATARRRRPPESLLHLADEALFHAREGGGNRVCVAAERTPG